MIPAVVTALVVAVLNLGFAAGMAAVMLTSDPLILGFGMPTSARPLASVAIAGMVASVLLLGLAVRAWWHRGGSLGHRLAVSIVLIAGIAFAIWTLSRGLVII